MSEINKELKEKLVQAAEVYTKKLDVPAYGALVVIGLDGISCIRCKPEILSAASVQGQTLTADRRGRIFEITALQILSRDGEEVSGFYLRKYGNADFRTVRYHVTLNKGLVIVNQEPTCFPAYTAR